MAVAAGESSQHTCALTASVGGVVCWGNNGYGQLGLGYTNSTTGGVPTVPIIPVLTGATAVATGNQHTCALMSGGLLSCWGSDGNGQLGVSDSSTGVYL